MKPKSEAEIKSICHSIQARLKSEYDVDMDLKALAQNAEHLAHEKIDKDVLNQIKDLHPNDLFRMSELVCDMLNITKVNGEVHPKKTRRRSKKNRH